MAGGLVISAPIGVTAKIKPKTKTIKATTYLKKKAEAHPLVVLVDFPIAHIFLSPFLTTVPYPRVRHFHSNLLVEETLQCVRGMDPAVRVQHVFRNVLGVDAIDRVPNVLPGSYNQTERYQ